MTDAPLVSFVVLSYNYARFIGELIASILAQQGDYSFEVIIVDDASTDDSHEVISAFRDPRIKYIRHETNQGHAATVTDGLRLARGRYVARIDSDDRYRPDYLQQVVPILEQHPNVVLVYGDAAMIDDDSVQTAPRTDDQHAGSDYTGNEYVALLERNFICAPTIIARREAWLEALPIPAGLSFHDWWFTLQLARRGDFHFCARVLADYRVHRANYHSLLTRQRAEEGSIRYLLDRLYAEQERDAALQTAKQEARPRVYAHHYLVLARKYFGAGMPADARRCYLQAVRRRPRYLADPSVARQLLATMVGLRFYQRVKALLGRA